LTSLLAGSSFAPMPTVRELVSAIRQRPGIDAAVVTGRDGLMIVGDALPHVDLDDLAARVPPLLATAEDVAPGTRIAVIEHGSGYALVLWLGADAALLVLAQPTATLAPLVEELRRYRERIADLV